MDNNLENNPFSGFFTEVNDVQEYLKDVQNSALRLSSDKILENVNSTGNIIRVDNGTDKSGIVKETVKEKDDEQINNLVEEIFQFTLTTTPNSFRNGTQTSLIFLKELAVSLAPQKLIDLDTLEQALFERLLINEPAECAIHSKSKRPYSQQYFAEKGCITYLFNCYVNIDARLQNCDTQLQGTLHKMTNLIVRNISTAFKQPQLYEENQQVPQQVLDLFKYEIGSSDQLARLLALVAEELAKDGEVETITLLWLWPIFKLIHTELDNSSILSLPRPCFAAMKTFAEIPMLASLMLTYNSMTTLNEGFQYRNTLLGAAFSISCLPKRATEIYEYFDKPLSSSFNIIEENLWSGLASLSEELYEVLLPLLKNARSQALKWLGGCLDSNVHRGRLSAIAGITPAKFTCISDGFALNLTSVLLRLAQPFVSDPDRTRLLRVDPTYPAFTLPTDATDDERKAIVDKSGVHMNSLSEETCLLPVEEGGSGRPCTGHFNLLTECFFMCHRALDLGLRVVLEEIQTVNKKFAQLQNAMREATAQGRGDVAQEIREQIELTTSKYFSLRCALLEPTALSLMGELFGATAVWLVQVALDTTHEESEKERESWAPNEERECTFPLPDTVPRTLTCVPELLLENTASYLVLLKRFSPSTLESGPMGAVVSTSGSLNPVLTMLLVFMSSNKRARNPHLRARLAECLECLLPQDQDQMMGTISSSSLNPLGTFYREALFKEHPHRGQIVRCLLDVFVSIEMTGESVSFEQKFNYRRPMYAVMTYLWQIPEQRQSFKKLASEAEENMEAVNAPLFLRFLNLLMNDAIFLLDEALTNMAQLRTMQADRESGAWDSLPDAERERNNIHFQQIGMTARIDNILGHETIHALEYLTSEIKSIFCHPMLSDRIAAMLNYFLVHLVGPKKKNFKVKDQKEYKFDPAGIVMEICKIYVHLSESDEFCAAVSRDGRSYNSQLFAQAQDVLARIGGSSLIGDMMTTGERVQRLASIQKAEDEAFGEVPDEFLDPIMSTIMSDPVILPSSMITVDRSTIARHLLSDQSDPFNRSLLTMDLVVPNSELKEKIQTWLAERRAQMDQSE